MLDLIRCKITSVAEGVIKRFTAAGRPAETFSDREFIQQYGFTSRPMAGAEGLAIKKGNQIYLISSDDRRYRLALEDGEVSLHDDLGQKIHLTRDGIVVASPSKITATAPQIIANADTSCQVNSPIINLGGDRGELHRMIDERFTALFNGHVHLLSGVPTTAPTSQLVLANHATDITRAK